MAQTLQLQMFKMFTVKMHVFIRLRQWRQASPGVFTLFFPTHLPGKVGFKYLTPPLTISHSYESVTYMGGSILVNLQSKEGNGPETAVHNSV